MIGYDIVIADMELCPSDIILFFIRILVQRSPERYSIHHTVSGTGSIVIDPVLPGKICKGLP